MAIDYTRIADSYDSADFRQVSDVDPIITNIIGTKRNERIRVLDLGCGTGSYIELNQLHFKDRVHFYGFDKSESMLNIARSKNLQSLVAGDACEVFPYDNNYFDYISCRYAFHHFDDKEFVIKEIRRCLKVSGIFQLLDVDPHSNQNWWVYNLFPEIIDDDKKRFLTPQSLKIMFEALNFSTKYKINTGTEIMSKHKLLERLRIRDTSQLHMVPDDIFCKRMNEVQFWPINKEIIGDFAFLTFTAEKH